MSEEGYRAMRIGAVVWFVVLSPAFLLAGGAEEKDLECFNRNDLETVPYDKLVGEVNKLIVSGIDEVVICISHEERGGTITVVEIRVLAADEPAEPLPDEEILPLGSFLRIHQELHGILGVQLSPYSPIQFINIPAGFSTVESISEYVSLAVLGAEPEAVTYQIGTLRKQHGEEEESPA